MADESEKWTSLPEFQLPAPHKSAGEYLRALVYEKIGEMVKNGCRGVACRAHRLEEELDALCRGFPENILIVNDYVSAARKAGYEVDAQMGSACTSEVLGVLGLTRTSPLSKGLRFEEFVNTMFAREWVPSIGVRTSEDGRKFIIGYLVDKYGKDHVATVSGDERSVIMSGKEIPTIVTVKTGEDGIPVTDCKMEKILKANLCIYTIDATPVHPIERECVRETNGQLVYREQLSEMLQLMSGLSYAWANWTQKCLSAKLAGQCEKLKGEFVSAALVNEDFRRDRWRDEAVARSYIEKKWTSWHEFGSRLISYANVVSGDHAMRTVTHREVIGEVNLQDIENALQKGERVAILVRHAERPPLGKDDPTFGENLGITAKGRLDAKVYGFALHEYAAGWGECRVCSSKMRRCRETAREISLTLDGGGMGCSCISEILGGASPYFGRVSERLALANEGHYMDALNEYFRTGCQRGFLNLDEATDELEKYIWNQYSAIDLPLQVMVTHDINVGCFLAGRKVVTQFDDSTWPHYLDAAVAFLDRFGRVRYGCMRYYENKYTFDL